ncbi:hypothetical protein [Microbispora sp. NPDC046933]|uniref:hypothetical protein n=1 Tax=Microbispora sp. NPDC046933 TaxID=3155618 RepID=UPI0033D02A65
MSDLDFFADLVITGTVLGLDHTSRRDEVEEVLGRDRTFEAPSGMISDFGLVEFGWLRDRPEDDWRVVYFGAQAHWLPDLTDDDIPAALLGRYGGFRSRLHFDELRAAVEARGFTLEERPTYNEGCVDYWQPTSGMGITAVTDPEEWDEPSGTVLKMLGPGRRYSWRSFEGREQAFRSYVDHLVTLPERELAAWLDRREPGGERERADWWACLRDTVARRTGGTLAQNVRWRRLGMDLDRHAAERGIDAPDEAAVTLITALARARDLGITDGLPAMDDAVERWLAATTTFADAVRLCAERPLTPDDVRLSRRLRNQIHLVQPVVPHLASAALAEEVRRWAELKRSLLRLPVSGDHGERAHP